MIRLTIDLAEDELMRWSLHTKGKPSVSDLERADMLWLAHVKKGLIVDGVRITKIVVTQVGTRTVKKKERT